MSYDNGEKNNQEGSRARVVLKVLVAMLAMVLVLMIAAALALNHVFGRINRFEPATTPTGPTETVEQVFETDPTEEGEETYEVVDPDQVTWETVAKLDSEGVVNILLIGNDARPGETRARSDSMMLLSLNEKTKQIQLTSFMRDMYVQIPGYRDDRINSAYALGGHDLLAATLERNFGVQVDGSVEINFEAFKKVIDILGGVDVEITKSEASYLNRNHGCSVKEGMNHLDGETALWFARVRKFGNGDYDRTERQRRLITAIIDSVKNSGINEIITLINEVLPYVTTDLTDGEILNYATKGLTVLATGADIGSVRIPADDAHYMASIRNMSVLVPNLKKCQEDLSEFLGAQE